MDTKFCKKSAKKMAKLAENLPDWQAETSIEAGLKDAKGKTVWAMRNHCSLRIPLLMLLIGLTAVCAVVTLAHICRKRKKPRCEAIYCDCATVG